MPYSPDNKIRRQMTDSPLPKQGTYCIGQICLRDVALVIRFLRRSEGGERERNRAGREGEKGERGDKGERGAREREGGKREMERGRKEREERGGRWRDKGGRNREGESDFISHL